MKYSYSLFLAGVFTCFILALPVISVIKPDVQVSEFEKRRLAQRPELKCSLPSLIQFPRLFEKYFNDHIGGRDSFISLYNTFNFKILKKSPISSATVGVNDWLFFNADGELQDYMGLLQKDFTTLESYRHVLEDRRDWLAKFGVRYLFLPVPNKMMIYEEFLPLRVRQKKGGTVYGQFVDHMNSYSDFHDFLDLQAILLKGKEEREVYFRTDTHWNMDGALIAHQAITRHLQQWFPQLATLELTDMERSEINYRGDLAVLMHIQGEIGEEVSVLKMKKSCVSGQNRKLSGFVNKNKKLANDPRFLPEVNGCSDKPGTALVIHDSFGNFLKPYFSEQFGKVVYMNYSTFNDMKEWIIKEQPDVVIDQRVARNLPRALVFDQEVEKIVLQDKVKKEGELLLRLHPGNAGVVPLDSNDVTISVAGEELILDATGTDPYLVYACAQCRTEGEAVVQMTLTSPQVTDMQFYYTPPGQQAFVASFSRTLHLEKGNNVLFFRIPCPGPDSRIRLDPGKAPGRYILHDMAIYTTGSTLSSYP